MRPGDGGRPERPGRGLLRRAVDVLAGHDIGFLRLTSALRMLLCVGAGMAAGHAIARLVDLPGTVGMMIGALPAFLCCFVVNDAKASRIAARSALMFVPFVVALFASLELHEYRVVELLLIVVLLFVQLYAPRFGVWAGDVGVGLFTAYLCGLLLPLPATSFDGLAEIGAASLAVTIALRAVFFRPDAYAALLRTRRAFLALGSSVLDAVADLLDTDPADGRSRERAHRRVQRRSRRYHEAALTADGLLAAPAAGRRITVADELHRQLFATESTVLAIARACGELSHPRVDPRVRAAAANALASVLRHGGAAGDAAARRMLEVVESGAFVPPGDSRTLHTVHRLALLVSDLTTGAAGWARLRHALPRTGEDVPFTSAITLVGGRPAGSNPVLLATLAARTAGRRRRVSPALRTAVQGLVAVAVVEPVGLLIGGTRFYWGVIGVLVVLAGTNSTHERVRKTGHRILGTVVGGAIGIPLVHLLGQDHPHWTLAVVLACLAVGVHAFTAKYSIWVGALVVLLCQLYAYSGAFSTDLITLRLAENALGAVVAVAVSAVVLPVATTAMARQAVGGQLDAVRGAVAALAHDPTGHELTSRARGVDVAGWQLDAVLQPLVPLRAGGTGGRPGEVRTMLAASARTVRMLAAQPSPPRPPSQPARELVRAAAATLASSVEDLHATLATTSPAVPAGWTRLPGHAATAGLSAVEAEWVTERLQLLSELDAALAVVAANSGMQVLEEPSPAVRADTSAGRTALQVRRRFAGA